MKLNKYFKHITSQKNNSLYTYYFLAALRVALVFIPQIGYIHPDEFFQSVDVIGGDTFELEITKTWEFESSFPIRSMALQLILIKIPLVGLKIISLFFKFYFGTHLITSYMILIVPRLIMCILSFLNDYSLYKICCSYGIQYETRLIALASSFVMLVFGTRTFSNSIEMTLCSVLLYYVSECMIHSNTVIYQKEILEDKFSEAKTPVERVFFLKMKMALPGHSFNSCLIIATLCVVGCFNRPTFLFFGLPIVFFWLHRGMGTKVVSFLDFHLRIVYFLMCSIPSFVVCILIDSYYYEYLTMAEIDQQDIGIKNFVLTPWNFVKYNIDSSKTSQHGVHPKYLHLLINIPLLFNILGVVCLFSIGTMLVRFLLGNYRSLPRTQSVISLMTATICVPTLALSLINHQEPRFLIPLTLPIIILHAPTLKMGFTAKNPFKVENFVTRFIFDKCLKSKGNKGSKYLFNIWFTINMILTFFFGFLHQGGVYQLTEYFAQSLEVKAENVQIHLVTSHIYNLPQSFLFLPSVKKLYTNPESGQRFRKSKMFHLHEYGGLDMDQLHKKLKLLMDVCQMRKVEKKQQYRLYLAIPSSLSEDLNLAFYKSNTTVMQHKLVKVFYPHLSTEAMPRLSTQHPCEVNTDVFEIDDTCGIYEDIDGMNLSVSSIIRQFSSIIHQFGLILYRIDINKKVV